mmetsp:Transcript_22803/g.40666  ORF Transcript_22803/g.40666 Transcript_22803/m.40666 type:complete len:257 (-) Transcript_22803:1587-2357(-)
MICCFKSVDATSNQVFCGLITAILRLFLVIGAAVVVIVVLTQPEKCTLDITRCLQCIAASGLLHSHADEHRQINIPYVMLGGLFGIRRSTFPPSGSLVQACHSFHNLVGTDAVVKFERFLYAIIGKSQQSNHNHCSRGYGTIERLLVIIIITDIIANNTITPHTPIAISQHARKSNDQLQIHKIDTIRTPPRPLLTSTLPRGPTLLVPFHRDAIPRRVRIAVRTTQCRDGRGWFDDVRATQRLDRVGRGGGSQSLA